MTEDDIDLKKVEPKKDDVIEITDWKQVKKTGHPIEVERTPGRYKYKLEDREISGHMLERFTYRARSDATDKDGKFDENKNIEKVADYSRLDIIVSIIGKPYDTNSKAQMEDDMPPWMMQDVNDFIGDYIKGKV